MKHYARSAFAAIGLLAGVTVAAAQEPTTVRMTYVNIVAMAPLYAAEEEGFFAKHGIKNELTVAPNPYNILPAQSQGEVDVNIVGTSAAYFNAHNQGLKIRVVSDRMQYRCSSDNILLARAAAYDEGLNDTAGLKGRKVAIISRGSGTEYWLSLILAKHGLTINDVQIVTLSYPDVVNALKTGAIDAGFVTQPLAATAILDGTAKRLIAMHELLPGEQLGKLIMSQEFIERDGGKHAAAWLAGWIEGVRFAQDPANKDRMIELVTKWTKADGALIAKMYGTDQWPYADPNGDLDTEFVAKDGQWMLDQKLIERLPTPEEYYDTRPLKAAQEIVGRVEVNRDCSTIPVFQ
ncbi:MAG: ABC transporter substrate-binding protein [Rhizobiaceae bacterium]|nr:ABC transporter substrate-binding protein [Rhizobiaceae bacterium]